MITQKSRVEEMRNTTVSWCISTAWWSLPSQAGRLDRPQYHFSTFPFFFDLPYGPYEVKGEDQPLHAVL